MTPLVPPSGEPTPSASMEPNLYEGDYIVVSKWSYGY